MRTVLLAIAIFLTLGTAAHAMGGREDPLHTADRLIAEQKYDEAIIYLTDFMKANPDRFDEGQKRIRRIKEIRDAYNSAAALLIDTIVGNPSDEERKLSMIAQLEALERNPSSAISAFLASTKDLSLFSYNRAEFERIMLEGSRRIGERDFSGAAKTYASGFRLYRPEFETASLDPMTRSAALSTADNLSLALDAYARSGTALVSAFDALAGLYKSWVTGTAPAGLAAAWDRCTEAASAFAKNRRDAMAAGKRLESFYALYTKATGDETESSFLPFAYRLVLGRSKGGGLEGIVGALDAQWTYALGTAQSAIEQNLDRTLGLARQSYEGGQWQNATLGFQQSAAVAAEGLALVTLWSYYIPSDLQGQASTLGKAILQAKGGSWLEFGHIQQAANIWAQLAETRQKLAAADSAAANTATVASGSTQTNPTATLAGYTNSRNQVRSLRTVLEKLSTLSGEQAELLSARTRIGYASERSYNLQGFLDGHLAAALASSQEMESRIISAQAGFEYEQLASAFTAAQSAISQGQSYLNGLPAQYPDALPGAVSRYPTRALESLSGAENAFKNLAASLSAFIASYSAEPLFAQGFLGSWIERAKSLSTQAASSSGQLSRLASTAREQKRLAETARQEGALRYADAQRALRENRFDTARERLDRASERYLVSLSYEEDPVLRQEAFRSLDELGKSILKAQNDLVVSETRRLITQGKEYYLRGQFNEAESYLLQARGRWASTNTVAEPEVEFWLGLVQTALTVKTGRDIPVTAPLYPEMSQLLSLARTYYEEAKSLSDRRASKTDILAKLRASREKIELVKLAFPLNQEAGILELMILKLEDQARYNREFASRMESARASIVSGSGMSEAYATLKDLEGVDPAYRGLKALIEQAEVKLGFRLPPPDRAALNESAKLTADAKAIFDRRDSSRYEIAKGYLIRALQLNPNNEEAARLKDAIATASGGDAELVLPPAAEPIYTLAADAFAKRDYPTAFRNYLELVTKYAQARKVQKVIDLAKRLAAQGYSE